MLSETKESHLNEDTSRNAVSNRRVSLTFLIITPNAILSRLNVYTDSRLLLHCMYSSGMGQLVESNLFSEDCGFFTFQRSHHKDLGYHISTAQRE